MTLARCGDPESAHALVSQTSSALANWPGGRVILGLCGDTGAYRDGSESPGVRYDPRLTLSLFFVANPCSNLATQNDAALRDPVASLVQTLSYVACCFIATWNPARVSLDNGTPAVAKCVETTCLGTPVTFWFLEFPFFTSKFFPDVLPLNDRDSIRALPALRSSPSKSIKSSSPSQPFSWSEVSDCDRDSTPPSAPSGSYGSLFLERKGSGLSLEYEQTVRELDSISALVLAVQSKRGSKQ